MYQFAYEESMHDSSSECRRREFDLFDRGIAQLQAVSGLPHQSVELQNAIIFIQRLWTELIRDLGTPDNAYPDELKAKLISIGIWVLRETNAIIQGEQTNFDALIDVNTSIRDGLK